MHWSYQTEFIVECPKCQHAAVVTTESPHYRSTGKLTCTHCNHSERAEDLVRYKVSVRRNCDTCGKPFEKSIPYSKEKINELAFPCPHCGVIRVFEPRNDEFLLPYNTKGLKGDPVFQLPLWLQTDVKGNLFWAYNRTHLHDIKQYVQAKLRERKASSHMTMVERLPTFIKEAKNRKAILSAIHKLERKS